MFSLTFVSITLKEFVRHPSAISMILRSSNAVGEQVYSKNAEKWREKTISLKRTRAFDIFLHGFDDCWGPSAQIGVDGIWEPATTCLILKLLRKNMIFVDVGANIGWFTLLAASKVKQVVAFEPESSNYDLLSKSVALNNFQNVILINKAVFNEEGKMFLVLDLYNLGAHHLIRNQQEPGMDVEAVRLDDALKGLCINKINVLKVDVEGAEPQVLAGAEHIINMGLEHIILEWKSHFWKTEDELLRKLVANYSLFRVVNNPFLIKAVELDDLLRIDCCNIYLRRKLIR